MIIDHKIGKEVESHFYNYQLERGALERDKADISEENTIPRLDHVGSRSMTVSNPTLSKAIRIEEDLRDYQAWVDVVSRTIKRFSGTPQAELIAMVYVERQSVDHVCKNLFISRMTYFRWKEKVINYAIILAVQCGLVSI